MVVVEKAKQHILALLYLQSLCPRFLSLHRVLSTYR